MHPESHENYLVEYVKRIPDIAVLSVDYPLAPEAKCPVLLQCCLDAYIWAINSDKFDKLEKVVFSGDSAGGQLCLSLMYVLHDICQQSTGTIPIMPSALVAVYSVFSTRASCFPSYCISTVDIVVPAKAAAEAILAQSPFNVEIATLGKLRSNASLFKRFLKIERHPYISPLYADHEILKNVTLHLVTSNVCPLLDHSVELAKKWKGKVTLDIVNRLPHGFLNFITFSNKCQKAFELVVEKLKNNF
jgi:acetyl esterase/lipase